MREGMVVGPDRQVPIASATREWPKELVGTWLNQSNHENLAIGAISLFEKDEGNLTLDLLTAATPTPATQPYGGPAGAQVDPTTPSVLSHKYLTRCAAPFRAGRRCAGRPSASSE